MQGGLPGEGGAGGWIQLRVQPSHEAQCRTPPGLCYQFVQTAAGHFVVDAEK